MKRRKLGRTQLEVSELCLNTAPLGTCGDDDAFSLLDTYQTSGGNFIQSPGLPSNRTVAQPFETASETLVGLWRETRAIGRDQLVLASRMKFVRPAHGGSIAFANAIRESCERSLQRLRTRHLDLLVCDWDDGLLPVDDLLEAVDRLIRAGLVRYAVAGEFPPWRIIDSLHRSGARNRARFEAMEGRYSLLACARFEAEALAMCREHRLGFVARSPLAGGALAGRPGTNADDALLGSLSGIADRHRASPAQVALAWVLRHPQVSSALVSTTSLHGLNELIRAASLELNAAETAALSEATTVPDERLQMPA